MKGHYQNETPEEKEIREAKERLSEALKKKAIAEDQKLIAARNALLQRQIEDEQRLADQREFARLAELQGLAKKREREEKEEAERRKAEQEKVELENRLAQEELKKFERDKHEKELLRLSEEAFRIEQEALQAEAKLCVPVPFQMNPSRSLFIALNILLAESLGWNPPQGR